MYGTPKKCCGFETAKQLIRSAGSVGANYRAVCRAKSKADSIYKLEVVLEAADASLYWLEVSGDCESSSIPQLDILIKEANELVSIFNASDITAKKIEIFQIPTPNQIYKLLNLKI